MPQTKKRITPLIEVPEIGWDFETESIAKTVGDHLAPFAKRIEQKWGHGVCFVDLNLLDSTARMPNRNHPVDYVFTELRKRGCAAIPVTGCERDKAYQEAIRRAAQQDQRGICLRLSLQQAATSKVQNHINTLLRKLGVDTTNIDLVFDLDAPANFIPVSGFAKLLVAVVNRLPNINRWRTFTLIGTSFPQTMGALHFGPQLVKRYEWIAYKELATALSHKDQRVPTFGDYAICHPEVLRMDMRIVKPAASLRYTIDDHWYILKGKNIHNYGLKQYRRICEYLVSSSYFTGRNTSTGDAYIEDCANKTASTGNLTTWRWVGTNHHIEKVVCDIANWYAP